MNASMRNTLAAGIGAALLLAACSGSDTPTSGSGLDSTPVTAGASSTVALESRTVPTVPPSTIAGQPGTTEPGVVNASPTIVPVTPAPIDPDAPATTAVSPTTELVGDPQPNPDTTKPPPPPTVEAPPQACDRLAGFEVDKIVAEAGSDSDGATEIEPVSDSVCRYTAGSVVAEVHFVSTSEVTNEWYTRSLVEPVGEVSGDAVGLNSFLAPGSPESEGYTIALAGGKQGVIVAVRGTNDARFVAGQLAIFANQAA